MNILIAGPTGAGKTTHALALAHSLGWTYVSGAATRSAALGLMVPTKQRTFWLADAMAHRLDAARLEQPGTDLAVNEQLRSMAERADRQVFDVWFLPWLRPINSIAILLHVPLALRITRLLQQEASLGFPEGDLRTLITRKDENARLFAIRHYGVDIRKDFSCFATTMTLTEEVPPDIVQGLIRGRVQALAPTILDLPSAIQSDPRVIIHSSP